MSGLIPKPATKKLNALRGRSIVDINSLTRRDIETILETAAYYDQALGQKQRLYDMDGKIMASMFYAPSTRTRLSFEAAMERLGGKVITVSETPGIQISSTAKGETLNDSIRVVNHYCDIITCRSPLPDAREIVSKAADVPWINAGDGSGEHPTQPLLDIYTVFKEKSRVDGLTYAICGDLKNGRAPHSLLNVLSKFHPEKVILASPEDLRMPEKYLDQIQAEHPLDIEECFDLETALQQADVIYMTRVLRERFSSEEEYERNKDLFILTGEHIPMLKKGAVILHPLPRLNEIELAVDDYPGAAYFRQAGNGVPVRMALLALLTGSVR